MKTKNNNIDNRPLSSGQEAMWFMHQMAPDSGIYNIQLVWEIPGSVQIDALKRCLQALADRHDAWRTTFHTCNGKPYRQIHTNKLLQFTEVDASNVNDEDLLMLIAQDLKIPFNLEKEPPSRWKLYRRGKQRPVLAWFYHHISADLWSMANVAKELQTLYPLALSGNLKTCREAGGFEDYILWLDKFVSSDEGEKQKQFWLTELEGATSSLNLPFDANSQDFQQFEGGFYPFEIPEETVTNLFRLSKKWQISPFSLYLSAYHLLLHKYTGDKDILVGTPTIGRDERFAEAINYFVNPIVTRSIFDDENVSIKEYFQTMGNKVLAWLEHRDYPLPLISKHLASQSNTRSSTLFSAGFSWENVNRFANKDKPLVRCKIAGQPQWDLGALGTWNRLPLKQQLDELAVTLKFYKFDNKIFAAFEYNLTFFSEVRIKQLSKHFINIVDSLEKNADQQLQILSILSEEEVSQQLHLWNQTQTPYDIHLTLHKQVELYAQSQPHTEALIFGDYSLSYQELNQQANQLAHYLIECGVVKETLVGISMPRSIDMYIAVLGVLKAGGAYVPLDPSYPIVRLQHMVEDSNLSICLSHTSTVSQIPSCDQMICFDQISRDINKMPYHSPALDISPKQLAYIIYTSGSTGKPKGVMIEHQGLAHLAVTQNKAYCLGIKERVLQFASLCFDASIYSIVLAWSNGNTLVAAEQEVLVGQALLETLRSQRINTTVLPPSLLMGLNCAELPELKTLIVAGEACPQELAKRWSQGRQFFNAYGPTETTVWATCTQVDGTEPPPIGRPIANTQVYILDEHLNPVPVGVSGELFIGGEGLARGYLNQPQLTKDRFIDNPIMGTPSERLYRTGDLARYRSDGQIEFLGRSDHQVKIRGFRIELGEIEACCVVHDSIREAIVTTCKKAGSTHLAAYVIPNKLTDFDASKLKASLQSQLPDYMVPSYIVALDAFPLTPNDKIDLQALPTPQFDLSSQKDHEVSKIEQQIADIWCKTLSLENIPLNANFFDIGGHSLKLAEVYDELPTDLQSTLTLVELYQYPTICALAKYLSTLHHKAEPDTLPTKTFISSKGDDIAIISAAMRVPGAKSVDEFWLNLCEGKEGITFFTDDELLEAGVLEELLTKPYYVKAKGEIDNVDQFDADFFSMTPREAQITDPQQRLLLECAWQTLEAGGYVGDLDRGRVGVFAGVGANRYYTHHIASHPTLEQSVGDYPIQLGNNGDFLATRIAYKLHLKGPAITVQTACSTSLVAVHMAMRALHNDDCDMALAGGVSLGDLSRKGYLYTNGHINSPDGHTRPFDADAEGTVVSQGAGMVLLKPLSQAISDADPIIAVIKGSAINNDGGEKAGFTAPSVSGQKEVIRMAMAHSNLKAENIGYVEAHGTGTKMGDPIEMAALTQAYRVDTLEKQYCAIGSLKSNLGHLDAAAGVTGLIKATLVVKHGLIPPTLHYKKTNPLINLEQSPFYVNNKLVEFPKTEGSRRAAVSAFGLGGTNAHAIVEQAPEQRSTPNNQIIKQDNKHHDNNAHQLICLSAKSPQALLETAQRLSEHITKHPELSLSDIAYTLRIGRCNFQYRASLVVSDKQNLAKRLSHFNTDSVTTTSSNTEGCVFMFPGQGTHYKGMGEALCQNNVEFRSDMDHARGLLKTLADKHGVQFGDADLQGQTDRIKQTELSQPLIFILEYCLAKALIKQGLIPSAMIGHSLGDYVAATLAEVFTLEQAIEIVIVRGQLLQSLLEGSMLAVPMSEVDVLALLVDYPDLSLASINAPKQCVISGPTNDIASIQSALLIKNIKAQKLAVHRAFHSAMLDPILIQFKQMLASFKLQTPTMLCVSSLTGSWMTDDQSTDPDYWTAHLRGTVAFADGIKTLAHKPYHHFIEVGPGLVLSSLSRRCLLDTNTTVTIHSVLSPLAQEDEWQHWLSSLGKLWSHYNCVKLSLPELEQGQRVTLPTYPFQRSRYWVDPVRDKLAFSVTNNSDGKSNDFDTSQKAQQTGSLKTTSTTKTAKKMTARKIGQQAITNIDTDDNLSVVLNIWQHALGTQQIKPHDDYFALGGDSLLAVKILEQLGHQFEVNIQPQAILERPTPIGLTDYIKVLVANESGIDSKTSSRKNTSKANNRASNLVQLQVGNTDTPLLVLIHPIGGEVYYYRELVQNLCDSQPVCAIQTPSLAGNGDAFDNIQTMAKAYLKEIKQRYDKQPLILGGASFGGLVALAMAKLLEKSQRISVPIVMIDTPTPSALDTYELVRTVDVLNYIITNLLSGKVQLDVEKLNLLTLEKQITSVTKSCNRAGVTLPPHFTRTMIDTWMIHQQALMQYKTPDYNGQVLYLRHGEEIDNFPSMLHRQWYKHLNGDFTVKQIDGNHISMNFGANAVELAKQVTHFLLEAKPVAVKFKDVKSSGKGRLKKSSA